MYFKAHQEVKIKKKLNKKEQKFKLLFTFEQKLKPIC